MCFVGCVVECGNEEGGCAHPQVEEAPLLSFLVRRGLLGMEGRLGSGSPGSVVVHLLSLLESSRFILSDGMALVGTWDRDTRIRKDLSFTLMKSFNLEKESRIHGAKDHASDDEGIRFGKQFLPLLQIGM